MSNDGIGMSLRAKQSAETRSQLIEAGVTLFGTRGYFDVSASEIVQHATVTRGALYHHFPSGKRDLFKAVCEKVLQDLISTLSGTLTPASLTWQGISALFEAFFDAASAQIFKQIVLEDAPSVMGNQNFRKLEYQYSVRFIEVSLDAMVAAGVLRDVAIKPMSILIFGACCEAALEIAYSDQPETTKTQAIEGLMILLKGIKA